MFWKKASVKQLLPPPIAVSHGEYSMIFSAHDEISRPTPAMIDLSLQAISAAAKMDLSSLSKRLASPPYYPDIWPGEHYKLLAGFTQILQPRLTIEIGTATGLSSLALLPSNGKLITFDLFPWKEHPDTVLQDADFADGRLEQIVDNLGNPDIFAKYRSLLEQAKFIFIDATHDGLLEKKLLDSFSTLSSSPWILFDDIRVWSMLKMWREISHPKLDLTSFGHWSGTGLVQLNGGGESKVSSSFVTGCVRPSLAQ